MTRHLFNENQSCTFTYIPVIKYGFSSNRVYYSCLLFVVKCNWLVKTDRTIHSKKIQRIFLRNMIFVTTTKNINNRLNSFAFFKQFSSKSFFANHTRNYVPNCVYGFVTNKTIIFINAKLNMIIGQRRILCVTSWIKLQVDVFENKFINNITICERLCACVFT